MLQTACLLLAVLALGDDVDLINADFEAKPTREESVPGWSLDLGAQNGARSPESVVEIDSKQRQQGRASLHFQGKSPTRAWILAKQTFAVRPGGAYKLSAWSKTLGVAQEGIQFNNCYVALVFEDALGNNCGNQYARPKLPTSDWSQLEVSLKAPESARSGSVIAFLSMTGDFWLDDLKLEVEGGQVLPEFETVLSEDFSKGRSLSSKWKKEVGATNGSGSKSSKIEIDPAGAPDSPRSLTLSGDRRTIKWYAVRRAFEARPGELFRLSAMVKAEEVRKEGVQFSNFHLHVFFVDEKGDTLGTPHFVAPGEGSYAWKQVSVESIAPVGTQQVKVGVFLSMSGQVWIDDIELQKQAGNAAPYADFIGIDSGGIRLHYAEHDANAKGARAYHQRLVESKAEICKQLALEWTETIDVFVYANDQVGRSLSGRELDFADSSGRRVHQRWNSYISHEMVHVIAHTRFGDAGSGLLGEGLAVWLDSRTNAAHHELAASLQKRGELPSLANLLSNFRAQPNSYPAAGSFCGWFLETHTLAAFQQLYPLADPSSRALELFGQSIIEMESDWHAELARH